VFWLALTETSNMKSSSLSDLLARQRIFHGQGRSNPREVTSVQVYHPPCEITHVDYPQT